MSLRRSTQLLTFLPALIAWVSIFSEIGGRRGQEMKSPTSCVSGRARGPGGGAGGAGALGAGGACALRTVGVDAADAGVRPGGGIEIGVGQNFSRRAVALPATVHRRRRLAAEFGVALDHLGERVVERTENLRRLGMVALGELIGFLRMTARAVLGRDDHRNSEVIVLDGVRIALLRIVAFVAADIPAVVLGAPPLMVDAGVLFLVAGGAGGALLAQVLERTG